MSWRVRVMTIGTVPEIISLLWSQISTKIFSRIPLAKMDRSPRQSNQDEVLSRVEVDAFCPSAPSRTTSPSSLSSPSFGPLQ